MKPSIFMVHGMWAGPWCWEPYRDYFASKGYPCTIPPLPYHDVSPGDPPPAALGTLSLKDYAAELERRIRQMDTPPVIMGHSMGGLLAQILGARSLARALVLLTPASPSGINALKPSVVKSFWSVLTRWGFWRTPHRLPFDDAVYAMLHRLPPEEQKRVYDRFVYESGRAAAEIGFWLMDPGRAAHVEPSRVTCPVLVVAGAEDRITPEPVVRKVARRYGADYKVFPGHAHFVLSEPGWERIAAYIDQWIENH